MAYGDQINVGLLNPDYSALERAGEFKARGYAAMGEGIGNAIDAVGDYFKEQGEKKKTIKQAETYIEAAITLFPEMQGHLGKVRDIVRDENIPLNDRFAQAESVQNLLNMGFERMKRNDMELESAREYALRRQKLINDALETQSKPRSTIEIPRSDGSVQTFIHDPATGRAVPASESDYLQPLPPEMMEGYGQPDGSGTILPEAPSLPDEQAAAIDAAMVLPAKGEIGGKAPLLGVKPANTPQGTIVSADRFADMVREGLQVTGVPQPDGSYLVTRTVGGQKSAVNVNVGQDSMWGKPEAGYAWARDPETNEVRTKPSADGQSRVPIQVPIGGSKAEAEMVSAERDKESFNRLATQGVEAFAELDKTGAIMNPDRPFRENLQAYLANTKAGAEVARAMGTKEQELRDRIEQLKPLMVKSLGMAATQMNSNRELEFYVAAMGDTKMSVYANLKALINADEKFGTGQVAQTVKTKYPELYRKAMGSSGGDYAGGAEQATPDELDGILNRYR